MVSDNRVLLLGATGFTGKLVAEQLVKSGAAPILVGRNPDKLRSLTAQMQDFAVSQQEIEWAVADVTDPSSIRALLKSSQDVMISTVGPFARLGHGPVAAAIDAGAAYVDCTGESAFVQQIFSEYDRQARQTGARLLTAFGFDYVPGNLAAALLMERQSSEEIVRVDIGYFVTGNFVPSSGTMASAAGAVVDPSYCFQDGVISSERAGSRSLDFQVGDRQLSGVSVGGTEQFALPRRYPALRAVNTQVGWIGRWSKAWSTAGAFVGGAMQVPGVGAAMGAVMRGAIGGVSDTGPPVHRRRLNRSVVVAVGRDASGKKVDQVQVEGPDPYDMTAALLAWGSGMLARGAETTVGALGPVDAFNIDPLIAGCLALGLADV